MTTALIADQPWSLDRARAGLVDRAAAAVADVGGRRLRVVPEPLLRRVDDGMHQSVRLMGDDAGDIGRVHLDEQRSGGGSSAPVRTMTGPSGSIRVLVPAVEEATQLTLEFPDLGPDASVTFVQEPVREWSIHLVQHSHYDIGYTDAQGIVRREQLNFFDSCVEFARASRDLPEEARFRWTVEALEPLAAWIESRPRAHVEAFMDLVRSGQIELTAMPYNLHMDTCSTDELHELLRIRRDLRREHDVEIRAAMQTDVPGQPAGLPAALAQQGVSYLSVAHNWAGRSVPHLVGGQHLPRLFRWRAPSGESVLVWMTDSPHGLAYMEGANLGFSSDYETVEEYLPTYLTSLSTHGYPYGPGAFGWHGPAVEDREPYPHDILHLRVLGRHSDNAPPTLLQSRIVQQWNETWDYPQLRMSTHTDFFRAAEERVGEEIPTITGDWGDWWVEGIGSGARPQAMVRRAQSLLTDAQLVSAVGEGLGGEPIPREPGRARRLHEEISLFNEHTWGASDPWTTADVGRDAGEEQWHWKFARALEARDDAELLLDTAVAHAGVGLPEELGAVATFSAINPTGLEQSGTASLFISEARSPLDAPLRVRDARSGEILPSEAVPQINPENRAAGHFVRVRVPDVPATGAVRLTVESAGLASSAAASDVSVSPQASRSTRGVVLENEHLRVEVDLDRSCLASIADHASGRELVDQEAVVGMNAYLYDTYTSAPGYNHQANKTSSSEELELLGSRSLAKPAVLQEFVSTAVEQRAIYEFPADGADWVRVTVRLPHDAAHVELENRLAKPATMTKESAYFAFPFAVDGPRTRYEITGGVTGPDLPEVPGAPQHMKAIRDWATFEDETTAIAWATADAPLIHPEVVALPYAPFPESMAPRRPGTVYSWVHNNLWDTNFPVEQAFETTFRYAIGVRRAGEDVSVPALAHRTAAQLTHPLVGVLATGGEGVATDVPDQWSLLELDDDRVRLVGVTPADSPGELLVRLQSYAEEPVVLRLRTADPVVGAARATYLGDPLGELSAHEDGIVVHLAPLEMTSVLLTRRNS
ncbi:glycoside hydrolase family 38 C-terminal domain-containing protein [Nesterenkonia halophila]|uniref:glycoside hydrolase family 38 N-terminal domain-containing protein n=1 Tax=Nesterenkonia halophila TaxID=302044 RepID=UPI0012926C05|nr:glycoside hydrolase family 38 C-terminal domain-containing protein [Nesterenkonia halophila]